MKKRTLTIALLLMGSTLLLPAQTRKAKAVKGKNIDIHLSAGKDSLKTTYFSVGLLATPYKLDGIGVNVVGTVVQDRMRGIQASGLLNASGHEADGLQVAGIANVAGGSANGVQIGGLMNISGESANGIQVGGLINVNNEDANGIQVGGLLNVTGENANGLTVGGLANISGNHANGLIVSGLMNVTGDRMQGVQVTSLLNVSGRRTLGLQVAALANVGVSMRGMQVGAMNYAHTLSGVQMGAMNYCDSIGRGLQVGVVNYSRSRKIRQAGLVNLRPDTRIQWMVYGGNVGKINTAARFLNHHTYTILGVGTHYAGFDQGFSAGFTYRAGLHQTLCPRLRLSEDLGYVHIENFSAKSASIPARNYALQGRLNLEYTISRKCALFASGGYSIQRRYGHAANTGHKPLCEWGIILF